MNIYGYLFTWLVVSFVMFYLLCSVDVKEKRKIEIRTNLLGGVIIGACLAGVIFLAVWLFLKAF